MCNAFGLAPHRARHQTRRGVPLILISSADRVRFVMGPCANPACIPCGCSARPISLPAVPAHAEPPGRRRGPPRAEAPGYAPNPYAAPPTHAPQPAMRPAMSMPGPPCSGGLTARPVRPRRSRHRQPVFADQPAFMAGHTPSMRAARWPLHWRWKSRPDKPSCRRRAAARLCKKKAPLNRAIAPAEAAWKVAFRLAGPCLLRIRCPGQSGKRKASTASRPYAYERSRVGNEPPPTALIATSGCYIRERPA